MSKPTSRVRSPTVLDQEIGKRGMDLKALADAVNVPLEELDYLTRYGPLLEGNQRLNEVSARIARVFEMPESAGFSLLRHALEEKDR